MGTICESICFYELLCNITQCHDIKIKIQKNSCPRLYFSCRLQAKAQTFLGLNGYTAVATLYRCHGKFVAPGKFFPPPYCHNVIDANPNPNLNPSPNPNPNLNPTPNANPKFNPILNFNPNPYCCVWE